MWEHIVLNHRPIIIEQGKKRTVEWNTVSGAQLSLNPIEATIFWIAHLGSKVELQQFHYGKFEWTRLCLWGLHADLSHESYLPISPPILKHETQNVWFVVLGRYHHHLSLNRAQDIVQYNETVMTNSPTVVSSQIIQMDLQEMLVG